MNNDSRLNKFVVTFATKDLNFWGGLSRIRKSLLKQKFDGVFLNHLVTPQNFPKGCPSHLDAPYAFKIWSLRTAEKQGADLVLWLDSSVIPLNIKEVFEKIEQQGTYFGRSEGQIKNKRMVGQVCSDEALAAFNLSREKAMEIPQLMAGIIGLDLRKAKVKQFLKNWEERSLDGLTFKGYSGPSSKEKFTKIHRNIGGIASKDYSVIGHRHDQTVMSILVHQLSIPWSSEIEGELIIDKPFVKNPKPNFFQRRGLTSFFDFI
jgi:hypothetical protein